MIRVSDEEETEVSLALSGPRGAAGGSFGGYLGLRRQPRRLPDRSSASRASEESVARRRALTVRALRAGGAAYLGQAAGRSWEHGRYQGPYLRDTLMDMGAMVETLETSHTWARLRRPARGRRRGDPRRARRRRERPAWSSATSRTPTPTGPRSTSPSSPAPAPARRSSSGRPSSAPPARRSSPPAARSPTITRSAATTPPTWRPRSGATGLEVLRARQGAARPGRDHEPRQAPPLDLGLTLPVRRLRRSSR